MATIVMDQRMYINLPRPEHEDDGYDEEREEVARVRVMDSARGSGEMIGWLHYQADDGELNQLDCLADIGAALGNAENRLWDMRNGYAWPSYDGLVEIAEHLRAASEPERDALRQLLRIGLQWHTQVTLDDCTHTVSQAYCSALPVGYLDHPHELWTEFARLVLEASYEATLCAALLNARQTGNTTVFLTLVGGGVFGNKTDWILDGLQRALALYRDAALDVAIVSYGAPNPEIQHLVHPDKQ